ncbi:hypothetical protein Tco_1219528 [Tanacetum coccineum]
MGGNPLRFYPIRPEFDPGYAWFWTLPRQCHVADTSAMTWHAGPIFLTHGGGYPMTACHVAVLTCQYVQVRGCSMSVRGGRPGGGYESPPMDSYFQKNVDDFKLQIEGITESILRRLIPNPPVSLIDTEESDDVAKVIFDEEQFLRQQSIVHVTPPLLAYTPPPPFLATMEPLDTLLMGDEVINTTPARENDEFIKSSVDDLVSIPRESEVTLVY